MPTYTYDTPSAIDLAIKWQVGSIEIAASERSNTVVTVTPTNPDKPVDRRGAEETSADFDGQRLTIAGPRPRLSWIGPTESVDLRVELPAGSRLTAEVSVGPLSATGPLAATRIKNTMGAVELQDTGDLWLRAGHGNVTVRSAGGDVELTADHGQVRIGSISGTAVLKASHGNISIGEAGGDVDARLSYGDIELTNALGSVAAKTAYGSIRLAEISSGVIEVESGYGQIEVGVRPGVPAWLDLASKNGRVRNQLEGDRAPGESEHSAAVRARTQAGDISITRAHS